MDPNTPGPETSEFKVTVVSAVVSFIAGAIALFHPGFHLDPVTQTFIVSSAVSAISLISVVYTFSRTKLKATKIKAMASVQSSQAYAAQDTQTGLVTNAGGQF